MARRHSVRGARAVAITRLAWGGLLLAAPGTVIGLLGGQDETASRRVLRILGARHGVQGAVELVGQDIGVAGTVIDLLHAGSALGFAAVDRRWRRPALLDALIAGGFAAAGMASRGD